MPLDHSKLVVYQQALSVNEAGAWIDTLDLRKMTQRAEVDRADALMTSIVSMLVSLTR